MTTHADAVAVKNALRALHLRRRRERSERERTAAAAAIADTLVGRLAGCRTLAAYVPQAGEPGAGQLPDAFTALSARVLLPVVVPDSHELRWAVATGTVEPGPFGLLQPVGPRLDPAALADADAVVVPALAVDHRGVRLGRGGGYYDRALPHARPDVTLVAVLFDDELVDDLPAEPHDRPMGAVVTPSAGWQLVGGAEEDAAR